MAPRRAQSGRSKRVTSGSAHHSHSSTRTANATKINTPVAKAKAISVRVLTESNVTRGNPHNRLAGQR